MEFFTKAYIFEGITLTTCVIFILWVIRLVKLQMSEWSILQKEQNHLMKELIELLRNKTKK